MWSSAFRCPQPETADFGVFARRDRRRYSWNPEPGKGALLLDEGGSVDFMWVWSLGFDLLNARNNDRQLHDYI